jgi:hypothetical protein
MNDAKDYQLSEAIEAHLKASPFLMDLMATHRQATAEIINTFLVRLDATGKLSGAESLRVLQELEQAPRNPSLRGEVGNIVSAIRNAAQRSK